MVGRLRRVGRAIRVALDIDVILLALLTLGLFPLWRSGTPKVVKIMATGVVVGVVVGYLILNLVYSFAYP